MMLWTRRISMKNHRFLWLRNRTTDNRKCEKARNIKEKRTIEMFNTVSKQLVEHHSSQRDNYLAREIQFKEITNLRNRVFLGFFWFCETSRNVMKIGGYVASMQQKSQQLWGQIYRWSMGGKAQTSLLLSRVPGLKNWWRNNKMLW